jgi:hypothetical protein
LLDIAELVGAIDWKDRRMDIAAEIAQLLAEFEPAERAEAAVAASLQRSGAWMTREKFAQSWFKDGAEIRRLASRESKGARATALRLVLTEGLAKDRSVWSERFLLLALWARAAKNRTSNLRWQDFLILAHTLSADYPDH